MWSVEAGRAAPTACQARTPDTQRSTVLGVSTGPRDTQYTPSGQLAFLKALFMTPVDMS